MMYGFGIGFSPNNRLFSGGGGANPLWNGLQAYYTADSTPNDALGTYNGTLVNGATYGTGIINQGFSLDGANDYVSLPDDSFKPTGSFSVSFWAKQTVTGRIIQFSSESPYNGVILYTFSGNNFRVLIGDGSFETFSAGTISTSNYTHIVFVRDSINNVNYIYQDGILANSFASTKNPTYPSPTITRFGSSSLGTAFWGGDLDEVGLWDRALDSTEVTELYNSGAAKQYPYTNPLWNGLQAYYTADSTPNDALGTYNGTLVNGATYGTGIINQGFSLDGVNDYVSLPDNMFQPTGDFSISLWVKKTVANSRILHFGSQNNGIVVYTSASNQIRLIIGDGGTNIYTSSAISSSVLDHVVIVKDSTQNEVYFYLNGVLISTFSSTVNPVYPATQICRIGSSDTGTGYSNMTIDEISLFDSIKTLSQVTELYNSGLAKQYS